MSVAPSLGGHLLRMHFNDCFVRGCDGSLVLDSPTNEAERDAIPNISLRGFQVIDRVKSALENACPGVASCADILALVARDVVVSNANVTIVISAPRAIMGGRNWTKRWNFSDITEAFLNLIPLTDDISELISGFQQRGLSVKDLVVLSGAHTIGTSHCSSFSNQLYNFSGRGHSNLTLDPNYKAELKRKCNPGYKNMLVEMDPGSFKTFDKSYYKLMYKRRGLFQSDAALLDNKETRAYVEHHALTNGSTF